MENRHLTFNPMASQARHKMGAPSLEITSRIVVPVRGGEETRHPSFFARLPPSSDYGATGDRAVNHNWDLALAKVKSANSAKRAWPKSPAQRQ
jgi:hypothetical protein